VVAKAAEDMIENCFVERMFIFKVVVQKSLIYVSRSGNRIRARPGNAVFGEFGNRRF
jgi:hypothetical protein